MRGYQAIAKRNHLTLLALAAGADQVSGLAGLAKDLRTKASGDGLHGLDMAEIFAEFQNAVNKNGKEPNGTKATATVSKSEAPSSKPSKAS